MIRLYIFLILLVSALCFGDAVLTGEESIHEVPVGGSCPSNLFAYYRFENGALTTDSEGTNTLTDSGTVTANTSEYKEGAASADFEASSTQYFYITDANLDSGFPFKSSGGAENITVCCWIKLESNGSLMTVISKYNSTSNTRSWKIDIGADNKTYLKTGYSSGTTLQTGDAHATTLSTETWYGVAVTLDSDDNYRIRLYNNSAENLGTDITNTFSNAVSITTADLIIGAQGAGATPVYYFDGEIDKLCIYGAELTTDQIDDIMRGTCPD
jgi:hypothetical protein